ncbi:MAG: DNRLRE domain-containing protein [bacterium]
MRKNYHTHFLLVVAILILLSFTNLFSQTTVTVTSSKDNTLYDFPGSTISNGAGNYFFAGKTAGDVIRRGVISFDINSVIPPCAVIQSVSLKLHMSKTISGINPVQLRKITSDWGEGTSAAVGEEGQGAQAEENDATWMTTFYDTQFWINAGGDFSNTLSASANVNGIGFYTWGSNAQLVSDVQGWINGSASNYGWLVLGDESTFPSIKRFDTKENDSVNFRPALTVTYTINKVALNLTTLIDGFFDGSAMRSDTARVYLRNVSSPYAKVDSSKTNLNSSGKGVMCFNNASSGQYYIIATHRNSIDTWSKLGQMFAVGTIKNYDFTNASTQAFGDNLAFNSGKYCMFNGDMSRDGAIDVTDIVGVYNDGTNFLSGYLVTDMSGDDFVDVTDLLITYNNSSNFVSIIRP